MARVLMTGEAGCGGFHGAASFRAADHVPSIVGDYLKLGERR